MNQVQEFMERHFESDVIPFVKIRTKDAILPDNRIMLIESLKPVSDIQGAVDYNLAICGPLLNDLREINASLKFIHKSLLPSGILVGRAEMLEQRKKRIAEHHSVFVFNIIKFYEFIFKRVLPKIKKFRYFYNQLYIMKHHVLSKCEILGRLRYCGFEILDLKTTEKYLYFVAMKESRPLDGIPQDGVLIKIPKVGRDGRIIHCHKLRTMHAYAEYLHGFVLTEHELDSNGKIVDDFRKTNWGRFLRKMWLDEMPQLYNIIKGDLSLVGLRALTSEFLSLYPADWRTERMKMKPGFIPPYYADSPKSFEQIIESEKRYYYLKKKHPVTTDIYYLLKVVLSFLSGKARTG